MGKRSQGGERGIRESTVNRPSAAGWRIAVGLIVLAAAALFSTFPQVWRAAQQAQSDFALTGETIPAVAKDIDRDENLLSPQKENTTHLAPDAPSKGSGALFQADAGAQNETGGTPPVKGAIRGNAGSAWKRVWVTTYADKYVGRKMRNGKPYRQFPDFYTCAVPRPLYPQLKGKWLLFSREVASKPLPVRLEAACRVTDSCGWIKGIEVRNYDLCRSAWDFLMAGAAPSRVRVQMRALHPSELPEELR